MHYLRISVTILWYRTRLQGHTSRGDSGALHPQSATAGVMLLLRDGLVWSVPFPEVLKDGSCAISGREPCQAGDRAALSNLADVPRGCLSGAEGAVNARKCVSILECMILELGLIRDGGDRFCLIRLCTESGVPLPFPKSTDRIR